MSKVYQNPSSFSTPFIHIYNNLLLFFLKFAHFLPFDFIKSLPIICLSIASKESVIFSDLASFISPKLNIDFDSSIRNISRFFSNPNYDFDFFYSKFISHILSSFKIKHLDKRVHISVDHGDVEDRFTVLMFSLKIGKQCIPIFFKSFSFHNKEAYSFDLFKEGLNFCHNLIKSIDNDSNIIFLADRFWSTHFKFMGYIESLGDTYNIRTKSNTIAFVYDNKEKHTIKNPLFALNPKQYHSKFFENISISFKHYSTNLAISKIDTHKEPFYILTNGSPKRAIKDYTYRFGSIEFLFKSFKTNGFFLEETQITNLYSFNSLYTCLCINHVLFTMIGIDYSKNRNCYKYKIRNSRIVNGKRRKEHSFFHIGLILLNAALDGVVRIFQRFILYDV